MGFIFGSSIEFQNQVCKRKNEGSRQTQDNVRNEDIVIRYFRGFISIRSVLQVNREIMQVGYYSQIPMAWQGNWPIFGDIAEGHFDNVVKGRHLL